MRELTLRGLSAVSCQQLNVNRGQQLQRHNTKLAQANSKLEKVMIVSTPIPLVSGSHPLARAFMVRGVSFTRLHVAVPVSCDRSMGFVGCSRRCFTFSHSQRPCTFDVILCFSLAAKGEIDILFDAGKGLMKLPLGLVPTSPCCKRRTRIHN